MKSLFVWLLLIQPGWQQNLEQNVGTKLVWHYTTGTFAGGEVTTYIMGDRRRTEFRNTSMHRKADGTFELTDPSPNVVIERCDLGQRFKLNTKAQEYASEEYPPKPLTPEERKARGLDNSDWETSALPAFRVETTTVDTGERELIFGQEARHVITTVKSTPLDDAKAVNANPFSEVNDGSSAFVTDGWYIDYDRQISCEPQMNRETKIHTFGGFFAGGMLIRSQKN